MTKEECKKVEKSLSLYYGRVEMKIDGYDVTIVVELLKEPRDVLVVYINGKWKAKWLTEDCEEHRRFQ